MRARTLALLLFFLPFLPGRLAVCTILSGDFILKIDLNNIHDSFQALKKVGFVQGGFCVFSWQMFLVDFQFDSQVEVGWKLFS